MEWRTRWARSRARSITTPSASLSRGRARSIGSASRVGSTSPRPACSTSATARSTRRWTAGPAGIPIGRAATPTLTATWVTSPSGWSIPMASSYRRQRCRPLMSRPSLSASLPAEATAPVPTSGGRRWKREGDRSLDPPPPNRVVGPVLIPIGVNPKRPQIHPVPRAHDIL